MTNIIEIENMGSLIEEYIDLSEKIKHFTTLRDQVKDVILGSLPEHEAGQKFKMGRLTLSPRTQYEVNTDKLLDAFKNKVTRDLLIKGGAVSVKVGTNKDLAKEFDLLETSYTAPVITISKG